MTTQVSTGVIADGSITTAKFDAGAVCPSATNATNVTGTGTVSTTQLAANAVTPAKLSQPLTQGTAVASTSGTSIDFTGIPSWAKRVTVIFSGVSTSGTSDWLIRLGSASGGIETTGYLSYSNVQWGALTGLQYTAGFGIGATNITAAAVFHFAAVFHNISGNTWVTSGVAGRTDGNFSYSFVGSKALSSTLDRVRITTANGTDTFDAGSINILYE